MVKSSEFDFRLTSASVIKYVGTIAGIDDVDFITPTEIRHKLAATDAETSRLLEAFLVAFQESAVFTNLRVPAYSSRGLQQRVFLPDTRLPSDAPGVVHRTLEFTRHKVTGM